ncbi:MAG: hypothetical protein NTX84_03165 [Nitrospirae bacterium]|nr:hypothetical protein [Nitrospirota bacterium]
METIYYLGGLVVLVLGFTLSRLRQRPQRPRANRTVRSFETKRGFMGLFARKFPESDTVHRPHIDANGNLMCFALGSKPSPSPIGQAGMVVTANLPQQKRLERFQ